MRKPFALSSSVSHFSAVNAAAVSSFSEDRAPW
jgi:hypothetical protein